MEYPKSVQNISECLKRHSKDSNITIEEYDGSYILHFDLVIDNSPNNWGDVQPMVSVVEINNGLIQSFNIRLGKLEHSSSVEKIREKVTKSRPPCLDQFDTGHSDEVLHPHIRMNNSVCSVREFNRFLNRLMRKLSN
jgi:hypothetical protein